MIENVGPDALINVMAHKQARHLRLERILSSSYIIKGV